MKLSKLALAGTLAALLTAQSGAITVSLIGIANDSVGRATLEGTNVSGRAVFVSTSTSILGGAPGAFAALLGSGGTSADFDAALSSLIGADATGQILSQPFSDGGFQINTNLDAGPGGNFGSLFIVAESGGAVQGIGAYGQTTVPAAPGPLVFNPATLNNDAIGTSTGGFQLAPVIPEPSVAILGALGALGLLRRRR